jgi:ribokinase
MSTAETTKIVISLGDLVTDLVAAIPQFPVEAGKHQLASYVRSEPGGAGNFLIAGARLGMEMIALGAIGDDSFGRFVLTALGRENINTKNIIQLPGTTTTTVVVLVDERGNHVFLGAYGEGPNVTMPSSWTRAIDTSQAIFSYGYTMQESRMSASCQQALKHAADRGIPVFFDPGPEMARTDQAQREFVLAHCQVLLMTEDEIPIMAGGQTGLSAAQSLIERGPQAVCVKRGPKGCIMFTRTGSYEHPGYPVTVRDTTAAGDSFAAAFIDAWLCGWEPLKILAFANAMGAAKVRKVGSGSQVPTAVEVQAVLDEYSTGIHIE